MIYLNNIDKNIVNSEVLKSYNKVETDYFLNKDGILSQNEKSKRLYNSALKQILEVLSLKKEDIVFTSGLEESSYLSITNYVMDKKNESSEIIVSALERDYIYDNVLYLKEKGVKIKYVSLDKNGMIDLNDLKSKINDNTLMVIVSEVDGEMAIRQPIKTIKQILKKQNPNAILVSDMSDAISYMNILMYDADISFISSEKVCAPSGISLMYVSPKINYKIVENNKLFYKPSLSIISAFSKAIRITNQKREKHLKEINNLNKMVYENLSQNKDIKLNISPNSLGHIVNISLMDIDKKKFALSLEKRNIFVSVSDKISTTVYDVYKDQKRASSCIKISFSYTNSIDDINKFLHSFKIVYNSLKGK